MNCAVGLHRIKCALNECELGCMATGDESRGSGMRQDLGQLRY